MDNKAPHRRLWDELVLLRDCVRQYKTLYDQASQAGPLLHNSAEWFFDYHKRLLIREIILTLSRITDKEGKGDRRNLVLASLLDEKKLDDNEELHKRLSDEIAKLHADVEPIRKHRHKYIAHLDLAVATGTTELPPITWKFLEDVVARAECVYRDFSIHLGSDVSFDLLAVGNESQLLDRLRRAERWDALVSHVMREEYGRGQADAGT